MSNATDSSQHLVTIVGIAQNFPPLPERPVERPHLLATLAQALSSESPVLFLEGQEGAGATTLLAQFANQNVSNTFSLFIRPASAIAYSPDYLRLVLAEQFWMYLHGVRFEKSSIDASEFDGLILQLRRRLRSNFAYILVDGLHQIPRDNPRVGEILSDVLPVGIECFRFLITGRQDELSKHLRGVRSKTYEALKLSDLESRELLGGLPIGPAELDQLVRVCQGIPGRLSSVRRLIQSGTSAATILQSDPTKYLEFLALEFQPLATLSERQRRIIAVLSFTKHALTREQLIEIVNEANGEDIEAIKESCSFLHEVGTNGAVEFVTEAHRRFAETRLQKHRQEALNLQVEALLRDPNSSAAVRLLPTYYQTLNKQRELVELISTDHYSRLFEITESIAALKSRAAAGARSALELRQVASVLQFSLQRSVFHAVGAVEELQSEVGALVALGQSSRALEIAAKTPTKERRIRLLAEYSRRVRERGGKVDAAIVTYIKELTCDIDFEQLGESAFRLAEDLLFVDPDLALSVVDNAVRSEQSTKRRDVALAKMSLAAGSSDGADKDVEERTRSRIGDKRLQGIVSSLNRISASFSFDQIKSLAQDMEIGRRIYFLRNLVAGNVEREEVLDVVDYAIDQLVSNADYVPKARDLADLASPLATRARDAETVQRLVARIEGQVSLIQKGAPSSDLVRLQMNLAHAEMFADVQKARRRVEEAYYFVAAMENVDVRLVCLTAMMGALLNMDDQEALERADGFRSAIVHDVKQDIEDLLRGTASHFQIVSTLIAPLCDQDPEAALQLVEKLNTEHRRDRAYAEVAVSLASGKQFPSSLGLIHAAISTIVDLRVRDDCIVECLKAVNPAKAPRSAVAQMSELISTCSTSTARAEAAIAAVKALGAIESSSSEIKAIIQAFEVEIKLVDSIPQRVDFLFEMVSACAEACPDDATRLYDLANSTRGSDAGTSYAAAEILYYCISLLSRAFRGLIRSQRLPDDYVERFSSVCDQIPCSVTRAILYADLVCRAACEGKQEVAKEIYSSRCTPILQASDGNPGLNREVSEVLFPAANAVHAPSSFRLLEPLTPVSQAHAVIAAARLALRRLPPSEPGDPGEDDRVKVSYEQLTDVVGLLARAPSDWCFYEVLASSTRIIASKENKTRLTAQQRADFCDQVNSLISKKLPDLRNIRHQGYVIASKACLLGVWPDSRPDEWSSLLAEADALENIADRVFVYLELASHMPARMLAQQKELLRKAYGDARRIPSAADRYSRLEAYIRSARRISPADSKQALREAMMLTFEQQPDAASACRRSLIDLAESIDPDQLDSLAELIDNDPARSRAKSEVSRGVEIAKLRRRIASSEAAPSDISRPGDHLPAASWRNLSALVTGRLEPKAPDRMIDYVNAAGELDIRSAYPVLSWFIESCSRRFSTARDSESQLLPLSEVILVSTEMVVSVLGSAGVRRRGQVAFDDAASPAFVVRPGERDSALSFIRHWLRQCPPSTVTYCDPYFNQSDVDLLRLFLSELPGSAVRVLTSMKAVRAKGAEFSSEAFLSSWNQAMDQDPPEAEIVAVYGRDGQEVLVHDRWLICGGRGLRLGTSFGSLGIGKLTEISSMSGDECVTVSAMLDEYFRKDRVVSGVRVAYSTVYI